MPTTVGAFTDIDDGALDAESPITESMMTSLRDNAYWIIAGKTKTTESAANKLLETSGSGGLQWTLSSSVGGANGTKGVGAVSINPSAPTQIAAVSDRILLITLTRPAGEDYHIVIDSSDETYTVNFIGSTQSGTLTSSYIELFTTNIFFQINGSNYEFYETDGSMVYSYSYLWI